MFLLLASWILSHPYVGSIWTPSSLYFVPAHFVSPISLVSGWLSIIVITMNDSTSYGNPVYNLFVLKLVWTFFIFYLHALLFAFPLCRIFFLVFHSTNGQILSSDFPFELYVVNHFPVLTLYSDLFNIISISNITLHITIAQPFPSIRGTFCFLSHWVRLGLMNSSSG